MAEFLKIQTITELHQAFGCGKPNHPLITVIDLADVAVAETLLKVKISTPFYNITLKTKTSQAFKYGRDYFDFSEGFLFGVSPEQFIEVDETAEKGDMEGWALYFHPDLIRSSHVSNQIDDYRFFAYETNEALHISDKEKSVLFDSIDKIVDEYSSNLDEFSQGVLVANIELLLNYIKRFYSRQFLTRKAQNTTVVSEFKALLKQYFSSGEVLDKGLPKVHYFASKLHLSDSYLSDLLKKEIGKNAQDMIHHFVIERAKNKMINTNKTISEIAYELGFEYPQYFSRLFKIKTGQTPKDYRSCLN